MRVAIIGRSELLYGCIAEIQKSDFEIPLIITSKESPEYKIKSDDFKQLAQSIKANYIYTSKINSPEILNEIKKLGIIDVAISINYSGIIEKEVIDCFKYGILNAHGGDLPRYRGNACQAWAIINGENRIGLCIHKMIGGELDSGDIICRDFLNITKNSRIGEVYEWMEKNIPILMLKALNLLNAFPEVVFERQSKLPEDALRCYPRNPEDGKINWCKTNLEILRLINASSEPFSGAFCDFKNKKLIIWRAKIEIDDEIYCAVPGQICRIKQDGCIVVICGEGKLCIEKVSFEDKEFVYPAIVINSIRKRLK